MRYTDLIFDLYGTLLDIHTEENDAVWEKTALYLGYYGAHYSGAGLQAAFFDAMQRRQAKAGQSYECFPDIPFQQVLEELLQNKGVTENAAALSVSAAQLFRVLSTDYIRLYPGVKQALSRLRQAGFRLWLLSNAQQVFTAYELRHLALGEEFDGVYLSSDYGCRKPDGRFFRALLQGEGLSAERCLMIGNDLETDIAGAKAAGLATLYLHTNLTPPDQRAADPARHPLRGEGPHWEFEGCSWAELAEILVASR